MAIDTYLIGNDGNVTLPTSGNVLKVRTYAATLQRIESDLTGFADTGRRRRLGMLDLTGSLNGVPAVDSTASTTTAFTSMIWMNTATQALTLKVYESGTNEAKIAANCIFNNHAFNVDKNGDNTVTVNFSNGDGVAPVVTWKV
jgi:hypothetical protein